MSFEVSPIAYVKTPYKEKFAIPRQPGLVDCAQGQVHFTPAYNHPDYLRGIEQFSHLWLIFQFHATASKPVSPLVRPPRLGGNKKIGVFASRSTFRPNHLGMSIVKLESVETKPACLHISGMDLLDNTPIIDIKPYLPYSDSYPHAHGGYADSTPQANMPVDFTEAALAQLQVIAAQYPDLQHLIAQLLSQDPRPAYQKQAQSMREYGVQLYDFDVRWRVQDGHNQVISVTAKQGQI